MQNGLPTLNPFATKCRTSTENFKDCRRLSPEKRLDRLIKIISSVLAEYSKVPTASPLHISVFTGFYQRAATLSPSATQDHPLPPGPQFFIRSPSVISLSSISLFQNHLCSGSSSTSRSRVNTPTSLQHRKLSSSSAESTATERPLIEEEVVALEKDWWSNEVVAAWYGPQPEISPLKGEYSRKKGGRGRSGTKSVHFGKTRKVEKDVEHVGWGDE